VFEGVSRRPKVSKFVSSVSLASQVFSRFQASEVVLRRLECNAYI